MGSGVSVGRGLNGTGPYVFGDISSKDDNTITTKRVSYQMQWAKVFKGVAVVAAIVLGLLALFYIGIPALVAAGTAIITAINAKLLAGATTILLLLFLLQKKDKSKKTSSNEICNFSVV